MVGPIVTVFFFLICNSVARLRKKVFTIFLGAAASVFLLSSCDSSSEQPPIRPDQDYLPLQKGFFLVYNVEEIIYELGVAETLAYELKTLVADSFPNGDGDHTYVIHQSKRNDAQLEWESASTWSVRVNAREAVVNEANIPYVVMRFPLQEGAAWNGNAYNTVINPTTNTNLDSYAVQHKGITVEVNGLTFSDCLQINQEDNQEFIVFFDKRTEVYARNVGLIVKEKTELQYCTDEDQNCIGQQIVDNGRIYKQHIKEYGRE